MSVLGPTNEHDEIRAWAEKNAAVPVELLPHIVDSVPVELRFMYGERAKRELNVKILSWQEFFLKFDSLGLTFVYDDDSSGYNELLQREDASPYRSPADRMPGAN